MTLRELQLPIEERYRDEPGAAWVTLRATGTISDDAMSCSVDIGRALYAAGAHSGVAGSGVAACSGDLLLGALAACAQLTCQLVAANMGLDELRVSVTAEGDLDLRGTLGTPDVPVGFQAIRLRFALAGAVPEDRLERLKERTERYCVVLQTLLAPPAVEAEWAVGVIGARRSMTKGPAEPVPSSFGQVQIVAPSSCLAAFQLHRRCAGEDCISVAGVISPEAAAVLALARALPARVRSPSR